MRWKNGVERFPRETGVTMEKWVFMGVGLGAFGGYLVVAIPKGIWHLCNTERKFFLNKSSSVMIHSV